MKPVVGVFCLSLNSGDSLLLDGHIQITVANKKSKRPMAAKIYVKAPRTTKIERIKKIKLTEEINNEKDDSTHDDREGRIPQPTKAI